MIAALVLLLIQASPAADHPQLGAQIVDMRDYSPCGLTSLYCVCRLSGIHVSLEQLRELLGPADAEGAHAFEDLHRAARAVGLYPVGLKLNRDSLPRQPLPAIIQVQDPGKPGHLLVLLRQEADGVILLDAPYPVYFLTEERFAKSWTGNVLVFARSAEEAEDIRAAALNEHAGALAVRLWIIGGALLLVCFTWRYWIGYAVAGVSAIPWRFVLATSAIVVAGLLGYSVWWMFDAPPKCVFDPQIAELGELTPGIVEHCLPVRNAGGAPLVVSAIRSSCTCAVVQGPDTIKPGETGHLTVRLSVTPGPRSARLTVESNDPDGAKTAIVTWHGTAQPELVPFNIDCYQARADRALERTLKVVYPGGRSALRPRFVRCECNSPLVTIRPGNDDPIAASFAMSGIITQIIGEQELHVRIGPPAAPGLFMANCQLIYQYGKQEVKLRLPISVHFWGSSLTPASDRVVFSARRAEALLGQERVISVSHELGDRSLSVRDAPEWLEWEIARQSDRQSLLRVRVKAIPDEPLVKHVLTVVDGASPTSEVPVWIHVCFVEP